MSRAYQNEVFRFETASFVVSGVWSEDHDFTYDGDDEDGETQRMLDAGDLVAFDATVYVMHRDTGDILGRSDLGGCVYKSGDEASFFTDHRDPCDMNRNCTIMRAAHPAGPNVSICHYFPDMVSEACEAARVTLRSLQATRVRRTAAAVAHGA